MENAPLIVWFATIAVVFGLHLRFQIPLWRASRRLEDATRQLRGPEFGSGASWRVGMVAQMFLNPNAIFSDTDTSEMRLLKQEYFARWTAARRGFPFIMKVTIGGLILSAFVAWLGFFVRGKP